METGIALAGLLVVLFGPFAAIAYRSKSKWPTFRDNAAKLFLSIFAATGFMGAGLAWAILVPPLAVQAFGILGWVCAAALILVLLVVFADWARDD